MSSLSLRRPDTAASLLWVDSRPRTRPSRSQQKPPSFNGEGNCDSDSDAVMVTATATMTVMVTVIVTVTVTPR